MKLGGIIAQGLAGAVAGAAQGAYNSSVEDQKQKMLTLREEQLAKLRSDLNMKETGARIDAETAAVPVREEAKRGIIAKQMQGVSAREEEMKRMEEQAALQRTNAGNTVPGTDVTADEAAGMPPETRKLYDLPVDDEQSRYRRRIKAAEQEGVLDAAKDARAGLNTEITSAKNDKQNEIANKRADLVAETQRQAAERADRLASVREASVARAESGQTERAKLANEREQRMATQSALKSVQDDLRRLQTELKTEFDPNAQSAIKTQIANLTREQAQYRSALGGAGIQGQPGPEPQNAPKTDRPPLTGFMK
jgi:hypothetical protein